MFKFLLALFPLVVCRVYAFPLSHTSTVTYYIPLVVLSVFLFFLLVAIKLVYMKQRRIGTIHAPPGISSSSTSSFRFRDKETNRHRGFVVGCLGSPAWETNLTARLNETAWRRRSSCAGRDTLSTMRSTRSTCACTKSTGTTLDATSGHSRVAAGSSSSRSLGSGRRTHRCHPRCGDFGEPRGLGFPGNSVATGTRRASPSSIRLVDGPSHSGQVEYGFLSGLPPTAIQASPLTGTRDSFQLSRCSLKCDRKPVPPLPPLPSFLVLHPQRDALELQGYLPELQFSPLVSVAGVFRLQEQVLERRMSVRCAPKSLHNKGSASSVVAPLRLKTMLPVACDIRKPLKSCLRQNSVSMSETSTRTGTLVDSTPISDDDLGILGLDRFHWNEDTKEKSSHMKKDSTVLAIV